MALTTDEITTLKVVAAEKKLGDNIKTIVDNAEIELVMKHEEIAAIEKTRDDAIKVLRNA